MNEDQAERRADKASAAADRAILLSKKTGRTVDQVLQAQAILALYGIRNVMIIGIAVYVITWVVEKNA